MLDLWKKFPGRAVYILMDDDVFVHADSLLHALRPLKDPARFPWLAGEAYSVVYGGNMIISGRAMQVISVFLSLELCAGSSSQTQASPGHAVHDGEFAVVCVHA